MGSPERLDERALHPSLPGIISLVGEIGIAGLPSFLLVTRAEHLARYRFAGTLVKEGRVLDVACGIGYGSRYFPPDNWVVGVDLDIHALQYAAPYYGGENVGFVLASASPDELTAGLPFRKGCFTTVVSFETIEHLENPEGFLRNVAKLLDQDGVLILSTPNRDVANPKTSFSDQPRNEHHKKEYNISELKGVLGRYFGEVTMFCQISIGAIKNPLERKLRVLCELPKLVDIFPLDETNADKAVYLFSVCRRPKSIKELE